MNWHLFFEILILKNAKKPINKIELCFVSNVFYLDIEYKSLKYVSITNGIKCFCISVLYWQKHQNQTEIIRNFLHFCNIIMTESILLYINQLLFVMFAKIQNLCEHTHFSVLHSKNSWVLLRHFECDFNTY
jgi:hypothetical protein